jgi:hypothetical protein
MGGSGQDSCAQERYKWWVLVNTVMNLRVKKNPEIFLINKQILTSLEGLSCMQVVRCMRQEIFLFSTAFMPASWATQHPIEQASGCM